MIRATRLLTAILYCACVTLSACGGGSSSSSSTAATSAVTPVSTSSSGTTTATTTTSTSTTSAFTLSGVVSGFTSATVTTSGTASLSTATDSSGNFSFASLAPGSYTVAPAQTGYVYSPVSRAETITTTSITDVTFAATASTAATYTLSGTVSGSALAGVTMTLNGTNVGSAVTDASGNYSFAGLVSGTYTVTASLNGYSFSAPLIVAVGTADSTGNNFTESTAASDGLAFTAAATLPQATVGVPYSGSVVQTISGGTAPYHYQAGLLDDGTPPLGMIANPNGNVTGTATVAGQYDFTVCAVDAAGATSACEPVSLNVVAAAVVTPIPGPPAKPTVTLSATPPSTTAGAGSTLKWSSTNATVCTASGGWSGTKATSGSVTVSPTTSTTYTLSCAGTGGAAKASVIVTVAATTPAPTVTLTASDASIAAGAASTLTWSSKNASACSGSGGWSGTRGTSGSLSVSPTATTTYTLACTNSAGSAEASTKITVNAATTAAPTVTLTASATTITAGSASSLTWSSKNADSCTATGGWSGAKGDSGTASVSPSATTTYTLSCSGAGGTSEAAAQVTVNAAAPAASGTSWVYYNGTFDWPGDFDFAAVANYSDTGGAPLSGTRDIMVTSSPYGGWLPYAQNWDFNSARYTKLTFSLKPTRAGQTWQVYFVKINDVPVGISIDVSKYGPTPVEGQWGTYTIPLSVLGVLGQPIYKFAIQDQTGASGNVWYIDNVGFVP